ncbi:D-alanyl-D-alanine carboxypeptidase family protein [Streptomyces gamaensis]|uniref:D-alanyl-D-alanine carboxypeptidase family protein n=1 Tax=Streptomyces gamaensis TaxID=1763542 RepID=A0ABW0YZV3_9ACTN
MPAVQQSPESRQKRSAAEPPRAGRPRRGLHRRRLWVSALALAVLVAGAGFGCAYSRGSGPTGPVPERVVPQLPLPWPGEGQSAVEVEGVGLLGTQGAQEPVPIASVTKVMTAYVILQDHPLKKGDEGPVVTVDRQAADEAGSASESTAPATEGQQLSQRKLLELMLIPSGNNIARLLARWDTGSQETFAARMNKAAANLGMTNTRYTGASGIEQDTVSTAQDQLKLARAAMKDETFRSVVAEKATDVPGSGTSVKNSNTLLGTSGVIGLKTGSTTPAGGNLLWAATVTAGGKERLVLGAVLHQKAGTTPDQGLQAALDASGKLAAAVNGGLQEALDRAADGGR